MIVECAKKTDSFIINKTEYFDHFVGKNDKQESVIFQGSLNFFVLLFFPSLSLFFPF